MIDIACCIDSNYAKYCCVMLTSLLENNKGEQVFVHVLGNRLDTNSRRSLQEVVEERYGQQIHFYEIDSLLLDVFPETQSYVSLATYCKLFIPALLPSAISRVLYLDCDLIVVSSLADLWKCNLEGKALAVVKDVHKGISEDCIRLGMDPARFDYFNAGVMLLHLDFLRQSDFVGRALNFVKGHPSLPYHDQDVLNALLHQYVLWLPYRYNLHDYLFRRKRYLTVQEEGSVSDEILKYRVIVHFSSKRKPWGTRCLHPWRNLYFAYLDRTPWRGERPALTWKERCWRWNRRLSGYMHWVNGYRTFKRIKL